VQSGADGALSDLVSLVSKRRQQHGGNQQVVGRSVLSEHGVSHDEISDCSGRGIAGRKAGTLDQFLGGRGATVLANVVPLGTEPLALLLRATVYAGLEPFFL
jgi:hypothetical protein